MPTIYLNPIQAKQNIEDIVKTVNRNNQRVTQVLSGQFNYVNAQEAAFLQTWQDSTQDDIDYGHPMELPVYIPVETFRVHKCLLRFKIGQFRSTAKSNTTADAVNTTSGASSETTTASGGSSTPTSGPSSVETTVAGGSINQSSGPSSVETTVAGGSINQSSGPSSATTTAGGGSSTPTSGPSSASTTTGGSGTTDVQALMTDLPGTVNTSSYQSETAYGTWGGPGHEHNYYRATAHSHTIYHYHWIDTHSHDVGTHSHGIPHTHVVTIASHDHGIPHTHNVAVAAHDHGIAHTHTVVVAAHSHGIAHTHVVTIAAHIHGMAHTHSVSIPGHTHTLVYGIYEASAATNPDITITINTVDRTTALGGPFDVAQDALDITSYILTGQWNIISIGCAADKLVRIQASVFVQAFIRPVGRLEPEE